MELIILAAVVIAVFGVITIAWVLAQNTVKSAPQQLADSDEATPDQEFDRESSQPRPDETSAPGEPSPLAEDTPSVETSMPVYAGNPRDEIVVPVYAVQLTAAEVIAIQIERLQAEYFRIDEERERLAQELLASWLIEKIEGSAGRLKADTRKEAQDQRQQLVKVSADFERVQFRLASLQHLQARLDDPRVARQVEDLVKAVKQLAGGR